MKYKNNLKPQRQPPNCSCYGMLRLLQFCLRPTAEKGQCSLSILPCFQGKKKPATRRFYAASLPWHNHAEIIRGPEPCQSSFPFSCTCTTSLTKSTPATCTNMLVFGSRISWRTESLFHTFPFVLDGWSFCFGHHHFAQNPRT